MLKLFLGEKMKKFKFKLNAVSLIMLILGVMLSLACVVWNIYNIILHFRLNLDSTIKLVSYFFVIAVAVLAGGLCVSVLGFSFYTVTDEFLLLKLGVLPSKIAIKDICEVKFFKKQQKLVCYHGVDKFDVIVIQEKFYDSFVCALREKNSKILYENSLDD